MSEGACVLVTGGAGFIGSHTCKALAAAGFTPVTIDNMSTGNRKAVKWGPLVEGDVRKSDFVAEAIRSYKPGAVIHFAASAYVGESVTDPAKYYQNNAMGMISLLEACRQCGLDNVIFSSSCATYGIPDSLPITENLHQNPINPYGWTKLLGEQMLRDYAKAYGSRYVILRYFNACGADPDNELGEWHDPETHLIPLALLAAKGAKPGLQIFGDDYDTADGTCVRDYIHVCDLARAHVSACKHLLAGGKNLALNLGSGTGYSIRQIINAIVELTGCKVPVTVAARRPGDPPALYADASLAEQELGFKPEMSDLNTIIATAGRSFGLQISEMT